MEEVNLHTQCDGTRMSEHPDDLLRELEVAEPRFKRLSRRRSVDTGARPNGVGGHERDPVLDRVRDWIAPRVKRDVLTDRLRLRILPWLSDQTTRGTRAGQAFWSALEPEERTRLWNILEAFRSERRKALSSLDHSDVAQISALIYRGLVAARQAWVGDDKPKAK